MVVHYIKQPDWFVETMIALLGTADEQGVGPRSVGTGMGPPETMKGDVVGVSAQMGGGVKVGKDAGL